MMPAEALACLAADGLVFQHEDRWKTGRRWQQAMARAAAKLYGLGDPCDDLRVPIAVAVLEIYEERVDDETIAALVETMLPIESESLGLMPR